MIAIVIHRFFHRARQFEDIYLGIDPIRRDTIRKRGPFIRIHVRTHVYPYSRRPRLQIGGSRI